nr:TorF family putative porin [Polynucleobacter paneuropaeus]
MKSFQKSAISAVAVGLLTGLASASAFAEDAPAPEVSPITANVTVASNYIYRGLTQTNNKPAIQGGFDYAHESGFYVGNWNSSITWISDGYGGMGQGGHSVSAPSRNGFLCGFQERVNWRGVRY